MTLSWSPGSGARPSDSQGSSGHVWQTFAWPGASVLPRLPVLEPGGNLTGDKRASEQVALPQRTAQVAQPVLLTRGLDALSHHVQPQALDRKSVV